ncbi:MAG TPA: DUF2846 domain-containing protein [Pyrinomonadaceae bacterium]|jgi:hypothetical protein
MKHATRTALLLLFAVAVFANASAQEAAPSSQQSGNPPPAAAATTASQEPTQNPSATPTTDSEKSPVETAAQGEKATVYVYRTKKLVGAALEPSVFCDGTEVARMDNGRFFILKLEPGEHRIHMTDKSNRVDVKLGRGETAYVRVKLEPGMWKGKGTILLSDEEDALKEIKKLKPLGVDKIKDRTMVSVEDNKTDAASKKSP